MPFRALIRAAEQDATVKIGLDGRGLYLLNDQEEFGEGAVERGVDRLGNPYERYEYPNRGPSDWDENDDVTYQDMDVDTLLLGVLDEVVGLLPNRRRALDLRREEYNPHQGAQQAHAPNQEGENEDNPPVDQNRGARFAWRQLGMIGATAAGLLASVFM